MDNKGRITEIFNSYLDSLTYLHLYDEKENGNVFMVSENSLSEEDYKLKLNSLKALQYRREIVEWVETTLESLLDEDSKILKLKYVDRKSKNEVMDCLKLSERTYYRKLNKAENMFVQVYDYFR